VPLAVFDIDGTLTDTCAVDDDCYGIAVAEFFAVSWVSYAGTPHHTDSAILRWLSEQQRGCIASADEVERVRARFVDALSDVHGREPHRFRPIAGAMSVFDAVRGAGWSVAIATGGWGASARLKLRLAGIDHDGVPLACADDAESRSDIVRIAIERAGGRFDRVVSVGDRPWDSTTAAALGIPFVGIASGAKAGELTAAGARTIVEHYEDRAAFLRALQHAEPPDRSSGDG
jgi:phosphoglycolate phosphatase-like HAD superfamily hydrolase